MPAEPLRCHLRVYIDRRDWWVGYFRGRAHHYVCPLPTLVIRWPRRRPTVVTFEVDHNARAVERLLRAEEIRRLLDETGDASTPHDDA